MLAVMERVMPFVLFALASLCLRCETGDGRHRQNQHELFHNVYVNVYGFPPGQFTGDRVYRLNNLTAGYTQIPQFSYNHGSVRRLFGQWM